MGEGRGGSYTVGGSVVGSGSAPRWRRPRGGGEASSGRTMGRGHVEGSAGRQARAEDERDALRGQGPRAWGITRVAGEDGAGVYTLVAKGLDGGGEPLSQEPRQR